MNATTPDATELEAIAQELRVTIEDPFVESGRYDEIMAAAGRREAASAHRAGLPLNTLSRRSRAR